MAYSGNNIIELTNEMMKEKSSIASTVKKKMEKAITARLALSTINIQNKDSEEMNKILELNKKSYRYYVDSILDLQELSNWYSNSIKDINDSIQKKPFKNKELQKKVESEVSLLTVANKDSFINRMIDYRVDQFDRSYLKPFITEVLSFMDNQRQRMAEAFLR